MSISIQHKLWLLVVAIAVFTSPSPGAKTPPPDISAAPVPPQILSAHKVFISNGEGTGMIWPPNLIYDAFYAGMKSWAKFELVPTPADADLVFEVRYFEGSYRRPLESVQLLIFDPKTHATLWHFTRQLQGWNRPETGRKNFESDMSALLNNVKQLVTGADKK